MLTSSFILKILLLLVTILVGVAGGIYFGFAITQRSHEINQLSPEMSGKFGVPENLLLKIDIGDLFPDLHLSTLQGNQVQLSSELKGKKSGIIFYSTDCMACPSHIDQWNQIVSSKLKKNAQEIILVSDKSTYNLQSVPSNLKDKKIFLIDWDSFREEYNLAFIPISITIDETGLVKHIQYGQRGGIDFEILKFLTTHDL